MNRRGSLDSSEAGRCVEDERWSGASGMTRLAVDDENADTDDEGDGDDDDDNGNAAGFDDNVRDGARGSEADDGCANPSSSSSSSSVDEAAGDECAE
jgi:hypothetical protein